MCQAGLEGWSGVKEAVFRQECGNSNSILDDVYTFNTNTNCLVAVKAYCS